jgi:hypothetical protein
LLIIEAPATMNKVETTKRQKQIQRPMRFGAGQIADPTHHASNEKDNRRSLQ